jgi:hypothetical protein
VGQVDHEAGIAARRALGDATGLQHDDAAAGLSCRSRRAAESPAKPAPTTTKSAVACTFERRVGGPGAEDIVPRRRAAMHRQPTRGEVSIHGLVRVVGQVDPDRLELGVLVMGVDAVVPPAEARRLNPPKGVVMSPSPKLLTVTVPARIARAPRSARLMLAVKIEAARP